MCPLRIILIFMSATLAGFFLLRNLNSQPVEIPDSGTNDEKPAKSPLSSKIRCAIGKGFWTFVDMASGKYLWKNLVTLDSSKKPIDLVQ